VKDNSNNVTELSLELREISSKDLQLWSIAVLVVMVLALGFVALVLPNLITTSGPVQVESKLLPQLFSGLLVLIVLFNVYLLDQRRRLNVTRNRLIRKLMNENNGRDELCDPLTKAFSRQYIDLLIPKETSRSDRERRSLTVVFFTISGIRAISTRYGAVAADHLLMVLSQLLKGTLRGSDLIARNGGDDFLAVMPDTSEVQAARAVGRVQRAIEGWNNSTKFDYKLEVKIGSAEYFPGTNVIDVMALAKKRCSDLHEPVPHGELNLLLTVHHTPQGPSGPVV
jgi:diguanylate cyclase (GGDEF)-like protein